MAFHNVSLPSNLQYGSVFGFGFAASSVDTASGHSFVVSRQTQAKHRYRLIKELQTREEAIELKEFILGRRGSKNHFRLKDWLDYTTNADGETAPTAADQAIGTGDGVTVAFQLLKKYDELGPTPYTRTISLPVAGTTLVAVDGSLATVSVSSSGVVTFSVAPAVGELITAGCEFEVPVRFDISLDRLASMRGDAWNTWSIESMECSEVLDTLEWPELVYPGGAYDHGAVSTDISLSTLDGVFQNVNQTASINAYLPAPDELPNGDKIFVISVASTATGSVQLRDDDGNTVGTALTAGQTRDIALYETGGTKTWVVY